MNQIKLIDIKTCRYTMAQLMEYIRVCQAFAPEYEIFMDGDEYAVVARKKK